MVVSDQSKVDKEPMFFADRVAIARVPSVEDERKAIAKKANGRRFWNQWEKVPYGTPVRVYMAYRGVFKNGVYGGRTSTYHFWSVEAPSTAESQMPTA